MEAGSPTPKLNHAFIAGSYRISISSSINFGMGRHMKSAITIIAAAALTAGLGGCVIVDADVKDTGWSHDSHGRLVSLYGVEIGGRRDAISIIAASNGCTERGQFDADVDHDGGNRYSIAFLRKREDNCKALRPEGERLTWSWSELGLPGDAEVRVVNRVAR